MATDYRVSCCPDGLVTDRRRRIKLLDCTIRDGGICNDWQFTHEQVGRVYRALSAASVDYMEIGYWSEEGLYDPTTNGPWRFCREEDLKLAGIVPGAMKLSTMVDCHRIDTKDIPRKADTSIDVVRIATYARHMDKAMRLLEHCLESGYETFINVMAVSALQPEEVDTFLLRLAGSGVQNVALVDSFGAFFPYHVRYLVRKYNNYLGEKIKVGVHRPNNQPQAFANPIAAIDEGVDFVDATIHGMGRGAGNCPLELLLLYLDNPRYDVRPILDTIEFFSELRQDLRWGYHLPYALTGYYNIHPDTGIQRMSDEEERHRVREMYETFSHRLPEILRKIS